MPERPQGITSDRPNAPAWGPIRISGLIRPILHVGKKKITITALLALRHELENRQERSRS